MKGSRYITHLLRLSRIEKPLANFFASGILNLRDKLGPFLWQFPPQFQFQPERLDAFFRLLPRTTAQALALARRHAVEIRHPSFMTAAFVRLLREHGIGLVVADTAGKWPRMFHVTADLYQRLFRARARELGAAHPQLGSRRQGRLRLFRQRRESESAVRCARPDGEARPRMASARCDLRGAAAAGA